MEKQAGAIGGAMLGMLPGAMVGAVAGQTLGKAIHRKPTPEVLKEMGNYNALASKYDEAMKTYNKKSNPFGVNFGELDQRDEIKDSIVNDFSTNKYDHLTVKEIEGLASKRVGEFTRSLNKTASLKSTLVGAGVGASLMGAALGRATYQSERANKKDPEEWRRRAKSVAQQMDSINNDMTHGLEHRPLFQEYDHSGNYSPSLLMSHKDFYANSSNDLGCGGDSSFGMVVNNALSKNGINYKDLNWGQYKKLIKDNYENIMNGEDLDLSAVKTHKKGNDRMNKQAYRIVNETFEKIAEDKKGKRYLVNVGAGLGTGAATAALSTKFHKAIGGGVSAPGAVASLAAGLAAVPVANAIQKKRNAKKEIEKAAALKDFGKVLKGDNIRDAGKVLRERLVDANSSEFSDIMSNIGRERKGTAKARLGVGAAAVTTPFVVGATVSHFKNKNKKQGEM